MRIPHLQRHILYSVSICLLLLRVGTAYAQENTGTTQQPLVSPNPPLDQATQEQFGLLTLSNPEGTCSASMLNDYWAITAAHCVFSRNGACPQFAANQISLAANWVSKVKTVKAVQVIPYGNPTSCLTGVLLGTPYDIALLQVGLHDLTRPNAGPMKLHDQRPTINETIRGYGRGINALAFQSGPTAVPSQLDGQYRWADFDIIAVNPDSAALPVTYYFPGNKGATIAGGDSGGPAHIQEWDDPLSPRRQLEWRLMGVHSLCAPTTCLRGQSCPIANPWPFVSAISQCADAAILPLRSTILAAIQAVPPDTTYVGTFPGNTPADVLSHKRALYAVNIDEPLDSPAGGAIDVQLTFRRCHLYGATGCPESPELEQWGYDTATHHLIHVTSGNCVNISGSQLAAGSPIVLHPCENNAAEKWTLIENSGTSIWSFKNEFTGLCLHAAPSRVGPPPLRTRLPAPAALVQMPCDGSDPQRFSNVDADWARRNGPH